MGMARISAAEGGCGPQVIFFRMIAAALLHPDVSPKAVDRFRSSGVEIKILDHLEHAENYSAALIFGGHLEPEDPDPVVPDPVQPEDPEPVEEPAAPPAEEEEEV